MNINANFERCGAQMVPGTTKLSYEYIRGNMRQIGGQIELDTNPFQVVAEDLAYRVEVSGELVHIRGRAMPLWHNKDKSENPCVATGWLVCPYSFSTKNGPQMGSAGGGEKPGLHLKDKFFQIMKEGKMGAWGITERESDAGLDQLDLITVELLEPNGFEVFHVADAMALLRKNILAQIELANRGCSPEALKSYIEESYPCEFTHAALLLAECIGDYYRSGELIVNEYIRESNQLKERAVKKFVISSDDLQVLLNSVYTSNVV